MFQFASGGLSGSQARSVIIHRSSMSVCNLESTSKLDICLIVQRSLSSNPGQAGLYNGNIIHENAR
jgi:hypothetical protein